MDNGLTENNMAKEDLLIQKEKVNLASGRMEKEQNGLKKVILLNEVPTI